jgi:2-oxoisovalerate dehydrogenase E1 component alpha subunit
MSEEILRVLDDDGSLLSGSRRPELSDQQLIRVHRLMLLNRRLDERMFVLQRQGRIGFYVGSAGEEASIIGSALALEPEDWIVPCYREIGAALVRGFSLREFICQIYGNEEDPSNGRQMPCHWGSPGFRLTSVSSPVGSQIPHGLGLAMAAKIKGSSEVALTYFGDGATSVADFHVSCNFAGVFKSPVIFFCRNNQWAISVPLKAQTASANLAIKSAAYGIPGVRVDGNDVFAVYQATAEAAARARQGAGPTLIEALTYRQGAHTTSDDPRAYRDDSEVEDWRKRDPIDRFRSFLIREGLWDGAKERELESEIRKEIQALIKEVEKLPPPQLGTIVDDVFESVPWNLKEQLETLF